MNIGTRFRIAITIALLVAAMIGLVLATAFERVRDLVEQIRHTDRVMRSVFELKLITVDYQTSSLERPLAQWNMKYRELKKDMDILEPAAEEERFLLERMQDQYRSVGRTFNTLCAIRQNRDPTAPPDPAMPMERRLVARMDACLLTMSSNVNQLLASIYRRLVETQTTTIGIVTASTIGMVLLIGALAWIMTRTAIQPLRKLGRDAARIGDGHLEHRTGMRARDEVGDLSRAFDRMLDRLNNVMASRDALNREVAQRKEAEKRLQRTLANLERSNKDLEQFAYSASHDLQEPLRKVMSFGSLLASEYSDQLEGDAALYVQTMQNATRRMQTLINDLLTYSRVTTRGKAFVLTDLGQVVRGVLSDLETRIEETGATVDVADLPTLEADPTQMRQLFQNLVGNALKFNRPDEPPHVKVYAREPAPDTIPSGQDRDSVIQCVVEDNGIGFDTKFTERIFGVFQRLHGRKEYSGSGIGLAVCRRIAERHGGTIQAESSPGQGARFVITLPRSAVHEQEEENP